jgi:ribosomal protein S18 acetylase RimI-like enzyme
MTQAPDGTAGDYHLTFLRRRQAELRSLFEQGRGAWYAALLGDEIVSSLGIVVTGARARYQDVHTAESHRGRGIATRLVVDAAADAASRHAIDHFVMAADPAYHAIGIYESVGFERRELVVGALRKPER